MIEIIQRIPCSLRMKSLSGDKIPFYVHEIKTITKKDRRYADYEAFESYRKDLYHQLIRGKDSSLDNRMKRQYRRILRKTRKQDHLLYRLLKFLNPDQIVDYGSCNGIKAHIFCLACPESTIYISSARSKTEITEISWFDLNQINRIAIHSDFMKILYFIKKNPYISHLIFIDGYCAPENIIHILNICIQYASCNTFLIIEDISKSKLKRKAWESLKTHKKILFSINLFYFGLIIFKK